MSYMFHVEYALGWRKGMEGKKKGSCKQTKQGRDPQGDHLPSAVLRRDNQRAWPLVPQEDQGR